MAGRVLADTGALLGLFEPRDQFHRRARRIAEPHLLGGGRFVGTTLILAELQNLLLARHGPERTARAMGTLLTDRSYQWLDGDLALVEESLHRWLERFTDQRFTLTDAVSFEVMRRERITHAFAFDQHFVTAGFELLR